jgi:hypothetical protein
MKKIFLSVVPIFLLSLTFSSLVYAQVNPGFDPNRLIEDKVFSDIQTFGGPEGVQRFLEVKQSILSNTNPEFLAKQRRLVNFLKPGKMETAPAWSS